jgi:predicted kinase
MPAPIALIVTGPPCTGKTTLGTYLARELRLPFLSKDRIKERLFDTLGWRDREWSRTLGKATFELLYLQLEIELEAGRSFLVECNFDPDLASPRFLALSEAYRFDACQVLCQTDGAVLLERFKQRAESGQRHPGHVDDTTYDELAATLLKGNSSPLRLDCPVLTVNTTDFAQVDYADLIDRIRSALPALDVPRL